MSDGGFTKAEREAMQARAEELRAEKGGKKKADHLQSLLDTIEAMPAEDKELAVALHQIMQEVAPELVARTWYGMPAYEVDGEVVVFLQVKSKFDVRYSTFGFQPGAKLDDGEMWPASFAVPKLTPGVRKRRKELVLQAIGK